MTVVTIKLKLMLLMASDDKSSTNFFTNSIFNVDKKMLTSYYEGSNDEYWCEIMFLMKKTFLLTEGNDVIFFFNFRWSIFIIMIKAHKIKTGWIMIVYYVTFAIAKKIVKIVYLKKTHNSNKPVAHRNIDLV